MGDAVGCANASEEDLSERRNLAAPEIHSRPKEIGEPCSGECSVPAARRNKAAQVSYRTEPAVDVVLELATPTVTVVGCRGCNVRGIGIYVKARVVVPRICLKLRGLLLRPKWPLGPTATMTFREADRKLKPILEKVNASALNPTKSLTFEAFAAIWERDYLSLSKPSTQASMKGHVKRLKKFFGRETGG